MVVSQETVMSKAPNSFLARFHATRRYINFYIVLPSKLQTKQKTNEEIYELKTKSENQRKLSKKDGITLIALIITIIVLVILAAVSISTVYNSKIINYATNGAVDYATESVKENEILDKTTSLMESAISNLGSMNGGNYIFR